MNVYVCVCMHTHSSSPFSVARMYMNISWSLNISVPKSLKMMTQLPPEATNCQMPIALQKGMGQHFPHCITVLSCLANTV